MERKGEREKDVKKEWITEKIKSVTNSDKVYETSWVRYIALTCLRKILKKRRQEIFLID